MKNPTTFSKNLKFLRRLNGLTQKDLAEILGITRSKVTAYESGFSQPNLSLLCGIGKHFDLVLDELTTADLEKKFMNVEVQMDKATNEVLLSRVDVNKYIQTTNEAQKFLDGILTYRELYKDLKNHDLPLHDRYIETLKLLLQRNWEFILKMQGS